MDKKIMNAMLNVVFTNLEEIKQYNKNNIELVKKIVKLQEHIIKFNNGYIFSDDETKESIKIAYEIRGEVEKQKANSMEEKLQIDNFVESIKIYVDKLKFLQ